MNISFGDKNVRLNVFLATMGVVGDKYILFVDEEDIAHTDEDVVATILSSPSPLENMDDCHLGTHYIMMYHMHM